MTTRLKGLTVLLAVTIAAAGCAAGKAFRQGENAMRAGNLDEAVAAYRKAVQGGPDNANFRIGLQRALTAASRAHLDKAHEWEVKESLQLVSFRASTDPARKMQFTVDKKTKRSYIELEELARRGGVSFKSHY